MGLRNGRRSAENVLLGKKIYAYFKVISFKIYTHAMLLPRIFSVFCHHREILEITDQAEECTIFISAPAHRGSMLQDHLNRLLWNTCRTDIAYLHCICIRNSNNGLSIRSTALLTQSSQFNRYNFGALAQWWIPNSIFGRTWDLYKVSSLSLLKNVYRTNNL